jgi:hypothetical protein
LPRQMLTGRAASSSPVMRHTAIHPMVAMASTPVSRTRQTLAGSSPPRYRAGAGPGSWTLTTKNEGRSFNRLRGILSSGPSRPTNNSWIRSIPIAIGARSSVNGRRGAPAQRLRSMPLSSTTAAPRSCGETPGAAAALSVHTVSRYGRGTTLHLRSSRRAATSSRIWARASPFWA